MTKYQKIQRAGLILLLLSSFCFILFYYRVYSFSDGDSVGPNLIIYIMYKTSESKWGFCLMAFSTIASFIVGISLILYTLVNKGKGSVDNPENK